MSKNVVRDCDRATGFTETLNTVSESLVKSQHRSGSSRIQSGLQAMHEKAREEGYATGYEAGLILGTEEGRKLGQREFEEAHQAAVDHFCQALESFVDRTQGAVSEWYAMAEDSLTSLAIEIARRAICRELEESRESVVDITRSALAEVRQGTNVRVRVNPFDSGILDARKDQILSTVSGVRGLEIVADSNVVSGCQIETDGGLVDARIESYLARIAKEAA